MIIPNAFDQYSLCMSDFIIHLFDSYIDFASIHSKF